MLPYRRKLMLALGGRIQAFMTFSLKTGPAKAGIFP
jgi:hypothetical protein